MTVLDCKKKTAVIQGVFKWKLRDNVTVNTFAYVAMGERSETSRDVNGVSGGDRSMRGQPQTQKKAEALLKGRKRFDSDDELRDAMKDCVSSQPRFSLTKESFGSLINGIILLSVMHTLNKVFVYTCNVVSYLFI
ncbi:hypothetical protein TNIN_483191 [Trichonephila inaurata madagascariensis]|uniref:Uncharacterized protein n=1 Tax=Trichonephila inaurata madagascariensis TaxID=2747483 RepID=A0A8X6MAD4_9ARAC|nr:hypothetical protein TNIN_483191 [Trichonephila inaurata madagascariensis]